MFSQVQKGVIEDIISGSIYYDNKTLSRRIWDATNKFQGDIQYVVARGILEKKSALELARDLEKFVEDPARRPWSWGKVYPNMRNTTVDYNAQRLARTAINHSYQIASIKSANLNPFVEGIEWQSAMIHGRTCQICMDRDGRIFPINDVPLDHPNGLCTMVPYISKSLDEVAAELRDWIDGEDNPALDDWYDKYREYFAFKGVRDSYNNVNITNMFFGEKAKNSTINAQDVGYINKYISSESYIINEGLRNKTGLSKEHMDIVNGLDIALSKISNYEGNLSRSLYFYSEEDIDKFLKGYEVGAIKIFNEYLSTTKGEIYNPYGQVQIFIINSKKGKDISKYNSEEQEVLYPRGAKFKVLEIKKDEDKYNIVMEEYDE